MKHFILHIYLLLSCVQLYAQKEHFEYYTIQDGLVQSRVKEIIQDKDGYMWFATNGGVSRYDGISFRNYTTKEGLINNRLTKVFESNSGDIWITTLFGLSRIEFDQFKDKYIIQNIDKKAGLVSNAVFCISQVNDSIVWVGTARGINKLLIKEAKDPYYKREAKVIESIDNTKGLLSNSVNDLLVDNNGDVWLSYIGSGVSRYDVVDQKFHHFGIEEGLSSNTINDLFLDEDGNVWCASGNGVNVIVPNQIGEYKIYNTTHIPELKDLNVRAVVQDFNGDILLGANQLFKLHIKDHFLTDDPIRLTKVIDRDNGLKEYAIQSFCQDHEKNIWMGTFNFGAIRYSYSGFQHFDESFGFSSNRIQSILEDSKDRVWVGTNDHINILETDADDNLKISVLDKDHYGNELPRSYRSIFEDSRGHIWLGSTEGLLEYVDGKIYKYTTKDGLSHNYVLDIFEDSRGNLWFATFGGLSLLEQESRMGYNRKHFKVYTVKDGLPNNQITAIVEDNAGNILLGTKNGLVKYDGYVFNNLNKESGLINNSIISLKKDKKGMIWIVTMAGISVFDDNIFKNFNTKNGLNSDTPYLLEIDELGHVWVGTNKGLNEIIFDDRYDVSYVKHYGLNDGIITSEFNQDAVHIDSKGVLWFGTQTGIVKFDRSMYCGHSEAPKVKIDQVRVFLKQAELPKDHKFNYDQNHITFDFVGLSFSHPDKIRYQFMLEGLDKDWYPVTIENFATWSNIPNGKYTFLLRSMNHNGVWNDDPLKFAFKVIPPFWKTNWFKILLVAIIITILYLFIKFRLRRLEKARELLQQKVLKRTQALYAKNEELVVEQERTKKILEDLKNRDKDITDSLNYAKRIQEAIMPPDDVVQSILPKSFVYFKPQGIVSGDFYWIHEEDDDLFVTVVDCTGHGVPGALMSIVGFELLVQAVNIKGLKKPAEILFEMNKGIRSTLRQSEDEDSIKDGMDVSLIRFNRKSNIVEYAGAFNPLYYVRDNQMEVVRGNRFPIGIFDGSQIKCFDNHEIEHKEGDVFYIFSDGYADQFGGPNNKKFKYKPFRDMLLDVSSKSFYDQQRILHERLVDWKGQNEQIDDICVIGFSF